MSNEKNVILITGTPARIFRQWAIDHASVFGERRAQ
jgi:hypothetical protein